MASKKSKPAKSQPTAESSSAIISLEKVCSTLSIPLTDVLDAFVLGSRLWGTHNDKSDYDAYVIIKNNASYASVLSSQKGFASIHSANIDSIVMTEDVYRQRLKECSVFDIVTLWVPPEFVLKSTMQPVWKLDADALDASVQKVAARDVLMAQKHGDNGKYDKTKKVLVHMIRMIMMATQILEDGKVTNWGCANELFSTLKHSYHLNSWESFVEEVLPERDTALQAFQEALARHREA